MRIFRILKMEFQLKNRAPGGYQKFSDWSLRKKKIKVEEKRMIESFNHYTLNTGDSRRSHPSEVDKSMYLVLKGFIRDSQKKEFVDLFDGVQVNLTWLKSRASQPL